MRKSHSGDISAERGRFRGCLLGLAVGDAVGTTVEFQVPGEFAPVIDMVGGGRFGLRPGEWTDDTSMALCLATSLLERARFDAKDQMDRYVRWWHEGYLGSNGRCVDIGTTTEAAFTRYLQTGDPYAGSAEPMSAGNGSIMRLAAVPLFFYPDLEEITRYSGESSRRTHGAEECVDACQLLGRIICRALSGMRKDDVLGGDRWTFVGSPGIVQIARGAYVTKHRDGIIGSGHVVKSLEAALWCFQQTTSFEEAILAAANLGNDADTTAAVCGQVAGAYYGEAAIPRSWLRRLALCREITDLADRLHRKSR